MVYKIYPKKLEIQIFIRIYFQVQVEKLNRASRLLLGALIEAHDVLEALNLETGNVAAASASVSENIERVRMFSLKTVEQKTENELELPKEVPANQNESPAAPEVIPEPRAANCEIEQAILPDVVPISAVLSKNDLSNMPDLISSTDTPRKKTPKKLASKRKKSFRLTEALTSGEREGAGRRRRTSLTWTEAGAKLREISTATPTRRRSLPAPPTRRYSTNVSLDQVDFPPEPEEEDPLLSTVDTVLRIVQVVGVWYILRKVENMFQ